MGVIGTGDEVATIVLVYSVGLQVACFVVPTRMWDCRIVAPFLAVVLCEIALIGAATWTTRQLRDEYGGVLRDGTFDDGLTITGDLDDSMKITIGPNISAAFVNIANLSMGRNSELALIGVTSTGPVRCSIVSAPCTGEGHARLVLNQVDVSVESNLTSDDDIRAIHVEPPRPCSNEATPKLDVVINASSVRVVTTRRSVSMSAGIVLGSSNGTHGGPAGCFGGVQVLNNIVVVRTEGDIPQSVPHVGIQLSNGTALLCAGSVAVANNSVTVRHNRMNRGFGYVTGIEVELAMVTDAAVENNTVDVRANCTPTT